jgi:hypothetical protein
MANIAHDKAAKTREKLCQNIAEAGLLRFWDLLDGPDLFIFGWSLPKKNVCSARWGHHE